MPCCWIYAKCREGRDVYNAGGNDRKQFYRHEYVDNESNAGSRGGRRQIPQASIDPGQDQILELQNELNDIDLARIRGHTSFNKSHLNPGKRVKKKGEYESYAE